MTFTLIPKDHLVQPSQSVKYRAVLTHRRVLRRRDDIREQWREIIYLRETNEAVAEEAFGPVTVLTALAEEAFGPI